MWSEVLELRVKRVWSDEEFVIGLKWVKLFGFLKSFLNIQIILLFFTKNQRQKIYISKPCPTHVSQQARRNSCFACAPHSIFLHHQRRPHFTCCVFMAPSVLPSSLLDLVKLPSRRHGFLVPFLKRLCFGIWNFCLGLVCRVWDFQRFFWGLRWDFEELKWNLDLLT